MRNRFSKVRPIAGYVGALLMVFGCLVLLPILVLVFTAGGDANEVRARVYIIPAAVSFAAGIALNRLGGGRNLTVSQSMLVTVVGWLAVTSIGALPFWLMGVPAGLSTTTASAGGMSYLDAFFEATAGFTTTGMTMLSGLERFPASIIFWRSLSQWLGGLGILSFFILVLFSGGSAHVLYGAESTKVFSRRPVPGIFNTVRIIWVIYAGLTAAVFAGLRACGLSILDALNFSLTTASTGGFAPYDLNAGQFAASGFANYRVLEYILVAGMLAGSVSFLVHYRLFRGSPSALWNTSEMRLWWFVLAAATVLVVFDVSRQWPYQSAGGFEGAFRTALFQTVSLFTTSGFTTRDIADASVFSALSRQVFLVLMVVGASAGSTSSGVKLYRVMLLGKALKREISAAVQPRGAVRVLTVDGGRVEHEEVVRAAGLIFAWLLMVVIGAMITTAFSDLGALESFSAMASAAFNIGPSFVNRAAIVTLHPVVKVTYIIGMLAGRLEILPVILLLNRRAWM